MAPLGTRQNPLYFLHVHKTGGSSLTRLLDDTFPAGSRLPATFVDDFRKVPGAELGRYPLICGHLGRLPFETIVSPVGAITLLRDPAERAWSHYRALRFSNPATATSWGERSLSFQEFLDDPVYGWTAHNFQARWLAFVPERDLRGPATPGLALATPFGPGRLPIDDDTLTERALATLDRCVLVGTTDRLTEFVGALGRLLGRWLPDAPFLNAGPTGGVPPPDEAREVRDRSAADMRLVERAGHQLDHALATLPPLPPIDALPLAERPYEQTMTDSFTGIGWHARVRTEAEGWHRWSGPGTSSSLWLPVRIAGPARLEIAVVSACDREVVDGLELQVQGNRAQHHLAEGRPGVTVLADVDLHADRPVQLEITVPHTRVLSSSVTDASAAPAAFAIGRIRLVPLNARCPAR